MNLRIGPLAIFQPFFSFANFSPLANFLVEIGPCTWGRKVAVGSRLSAIGQSDYAKVGQRPHSLTPTPDPYVLYARSHWPPAHSMIKRRGPRACFCRMRHRRLARYVGCSTVTIRREALRNPEFHDHLRQADLAMQLSPLQRCKASNIHWRAAAWMLERTNPDRFGRRNPEHVTPKQLEAFVERIVELLRRSIARRSILPTDVARSRGRDEEHRPQC